MYIRFKVLTAVVMNTVIVRDLAPCSPCVNQCLGETYHLHLQCWKSAEQETSFQQVTSYGLHGAISQKMATCYDVCPGYVHILLFKHLDYQSNNTQCVHVSPPLLKLLPVFLVLCKTRGCCMGGYPVHGPIPNLDASRGRLDYRRVKFSSSTSLQGSPSLHSCPSPTTGRRVGFNKFRGFESASELVGLDLFSCKIDLNVRFEVFKAVTMKTAVFWDIESQFLPHRKHVSATETSRLMLRKIWSFHGGDYDECRLVRCDAVWLL
jgi:hypothetical protein